MTTRYWEDPGTMLWYEYREVNPGDFEFTSDSVQAWKRDPGFQSWSQIEAHMRVMGFIEKPPFVPWTYNVTAVNTNPKTYPLGTIRRWENAASGNWKEYRESTPGSFEYTISSWSNNSWTASSAPNWTVIEQDMASQGYIEVQGWTGQLPIGQGNKGLSPTFGLPISSYTTKYRPQVNDTVRVIGSMSYSSVKLHGQIGKVTYVDPNGHYINLDIEQTLNGFGKGLHPEEVELHQNITLSSSIDFIPIDLKIEDIKTTPRHKCHCDLTGPNCWLGCRCGGI